MVSFWQDRRTADAAFAAACAALGCGPDERHEEAGGTAFWWTASHPAWPHGVIVFWRHGRDWRFIPLVRDENPVRGGVDRLPWQPSYRQARSPSGLQNFSKKDLA
ncbi:hypothetical protein [Streptomyces geysiriensis]|uniref:hypothetical protein n=1 Tax=Streptomyces geysiriensis TaxID=68207 RepID=UPI001C7DF898|nr:hypothetical protein [Streptomyces geysiriensis]MBX4179833.1 hypothetical protein [Streptomyces geysiriensis]